MASADGMILAAGGLAFAGNFAKSGGFPENGYGIVGGTVALAFILALTKNTPISTPAKAFAGLTLLVAIYVYVPHLTKKNRKAKKNG